MCPGEQVHYRARQLLGDPQAKAMDLAVVVSRKRQDRVQGRVQGR